MAAKKKSAGKTAASKEEYLTLVSDCGGDEQLKVVDDYNTTVHKTLYRAVKEAEDDAKNRADNGDGAGSYVIVKVVKRGHSAGLVWK